MAKTKAEITERYNADMEVAEAFRAENPERFNELALAAANRRSDALDVLADEAERVSATTRLEAARERIKGKYPKAAGFPGAFNGETEEAIEASAKAASDYVEGRERQAEEAARRESRGRTARAWSPTGSPIVPGTEIRQESGGAAAQAQEASGRLATLRQAAGTRAVVDHPLAGNEEAVLADMRAAGRMRSTSDEAFLAGGVKGGGTLDEEDRRG